MQPGALRRVRNLGAMHPPARGGTVLFLTVSEFLIRDAAALYSRCLDEILSGIDLGEIA